MISWSSMDPFRHAKYHQIIYQILASCTSSTISSLERLQYFRISTSFNHEFNHDSPWCVARSRSLGLPAFSLNGSASAFGAQPSTSRWSMSTAVEIEASRSPWSCSKRPCQWCQGCPVKTGGLVFGEWTRSWRKNLGEKRWDDRLSITLYNIFIYINNIYIYIMYVYMHTHMYIIYHWKGHRKSKSEVNNCIIMQNICWLSGKYWEIIGTLWSINGRIAWEWSQSIVRNPMEITIPENS